MDAKKEKDDIVRRYRTLSNPLIYYKIEELLDILNKAEEIHIGTDSLPNKIIQDKIIFATVICIRNPNKNGGRAFYSLNKTKYKTIGERLFLETYFSVETAIELINLNQNFLNKIIVHIDANKSTVTESSKYVENLVALVMSNGFKYRLKPNAWASATVADKIVRNRLGMFI